MTDGTADDTAADTPQSEATATAYARQKRYAWLVDLSLMLAVLVALVFTDASASLRDLAFDVSGVDAVAALVYAVILLTGISLLSLPIDFFSGFVLEHRFKLSRESAAGWLKDWLKGFALQLLLGGAAIELIYALIRPFADTWWLIAAGAFMLLFVLLANLAPVLILPLFFKFEPVADEDLRERLLRLSDRLGARVRGVYVWKLGEKSRKSNAALMGWGNTRRIVVTDTLLESSTADEVEVVLAHELGHHVNRDIPRLIVFQGAITFAGFGIVHLALSAWSEPLGFDGVGDFANLPLLLLVVLVASLLALPMANSYSRRRERAADAFALRVTGRPDTFIDAMEKLGRQNLSQRQPHPLIEFLFHSHPSIAKRVEFAMAWPRPERRAEPASLER